MGNDVGKVRRDFAVVRAVRLFIGHGAPGLPSVGGCRAAASFALYSWKRACMRRKTGPGTPAPTGFPSSVVTASTSLVDEVSQISSAERTSASVTGRTS